MNDDIVRELKKQVKEKDHEIKYLQKLVERDDLTGLYNRRGFLGGGTAFY